MLLLLALPLLLGLLLLWMADYPQRAGLRAVPPRTVPGLTPRPRTTADPRELRVLVWNIAWGYGWQSEGNGPAKPASHFDASLSALSRTLQALDPDLVLLQEVDFDATRSHHLDQARLLAERAGLPYYAEALSWKARWVPFPYWPPSDQFGAMRSGGAILSRVPITQHRVELLEKPRENPFWYNLFYLFRYLQRAEIDWDGHPLVVLNCHLEAFHTETRVRQAELCAQRLAAEPRGLVLFGGDLNAVPGEAGTKHDYPDEQGRGITSHQGDTTVDVLRAVPGLQDSVPKDSYLSGEERWLTFPSHAPNRMLDHLFYGQGLELIEARVPAAEAGTTSDHLPLFVRLRLRAPGSPVPPAG